jgi:hypothetical protein
MHAQISHQYALTGEDSIRAFPIGTDKKRFMAPAKVDSRINKISSQRWNAAIEFAIPVYWRNDADVPDQLYQTNLDASVKQA